MTLLQTILIASTLLGFFVSLNLLYSWFTKKDHLPKLFLALFLFFFSIILWDNWGGPIQWLDRIWIFDSYGFLAPLLYCFVRCSLDTTETFSKKYWLLFIPGGLEFGTQLFRALDFRIFQTYLIPDYDYYIFLEVLEVFSFFYSLFFMVLIGQHLWQYFEQGGTKTPVERLRFTWIVRLYFFQLIIILVWGGILYPAEFSWSWFSIGIGLLMSLFLLSISSDNIRNPEVIHSFETMIYKPNLRKLQVENNPNAAAEALQLEQLILEQSLHHNPDLNIGLLSKQLKISKDQFSQLVNHQFGKSFRVYINDLRIEDAKIMLLSRRCAHYTILGIALTVGFKSESTFYEAFKRNTHMTPKAFRIKRGTS